MSKQIEFPIASRALFPLIFQITFLLPLLAGCGGSGSSSTNAAPKNNTAQASPVATTSPNVADAAVTPRRTGGTAKIVVERSPNWLGPDVMAITVNGQKLGEVGYAEKTAVVKEFEFPLLATNGANTIQVACADSVIDPTYVTEKQFSALPGSVTKVVLVYNKVLFGRSNVDINISTEVDGVRPAP